MKSILFLITIILFFSCRSLNTGNTKAEQDTIMPVIPSKIGLNELNTKGYFKKAGGKHVFVVEQVILRGRSVPVVNSGDELPLRIKPDSIITYNKKLTVTLKVRQGLESSQIIWELKE